MPALSPFLPVPTEMAPTPADRLLIEAVLAVPGGRDVLEALLADGRNPLAALAQAASIVLGPTTTPFLAG